jgi:antitoxin ParD1/3/4
VNVSLTPELEKFVSERVESGLYHSASEVVRDGLRLLRERSLLEELRRNELRRDIQQGLQQIADGSYTEWTADTLPQLSEGIKAQGRLRRKKK